MTAPTSAALPAAAGPAPGVLARVLIVLVSGYRQVVSPLLPPRCRFAPSCSSYAVLALQRHGAVRGLALSIARVARCHPFHPGGHDPVPPPRAAAGSLTPAPTAPVPALTTRRSGATRA